MKNNILRMTTSALLIAIGIIIPLFSPVKLHFPPASYTLASHVPIFLGMMISPSVAIAVTIGTTAGFFLSTSPIIALRAASHLIFVLIGSLYLKKRQTLLKSPIETRIFSFVIAIIHAICEVLVVAIFFFNGTLNEAIYQQGFLFYGILLVGAGTIIHSMIDFEIALILHKTLSKYSGVTFL